MFKVGDRVVYLSKIAPEHEDVYEVDHLNKDSCFILHLGFDCKAMYEDIRHATPEENAAGHRIALKPSNSMELETLRDCDTSPNCKKFDEQVK